MYELFPIPQPRMPFNAISSKYTCDPMKMWFIIEQSSCRRRHTFTAVNLIEFTNRKKVRVSAEHSFEREKKLSFECIRSHCQQGVWKFKLSYASIGLLKFVQQFCCVCVFLLYIHHFRQHTLIMTECRTKWKGRMRYTMSIYGADATMWETFKLAKFHWSRW